MSLNLNPLGLNSYAPSNYVQPDYRTPSLISAVASPVGADELSLSNPIPTYVQPGTSFFIASNPAKPLGS